MRGNRLLLFIILIGFIIIVPIQAVFADTNNTSEINIEITPSDSLFKIPNMKPGDWAPRAILIHNNGELEFKYNMHIQNNGETKLFNKLILEISNDNNQLYKGRIADFDGFALRELSPLSEEELQITVRFPEYLGNDFQGLDTAFSFVFIAEDKGRMVDESSIVSMIGSDGSVTPNGQGLPYTATNYFKLLLIGGMVFVSGGLFMDYNRRKAVNHI